MKDMIQEKEKILQANFRNFPAFSKKILVKSKVGDPFCDRVLVEESLGCVIKHTRFMVSNDFNTPRVTGCWPQKSLPLPPDPPSVKEDLKKSISPV